MRHLTTDSSTFLYVFDFAMITEVPGFNSTHKCDAVKHFICWTYNLRFENLTFCCVWRKNVKININLSNAKVH